MNNRIISFVEFVKLAFLILAVALAVLLWLFTQSLGRPKPEPDFFYDDEGPVLIVEQTTDVRQVSCFLERFGRSELRPVEIRYEKLYTESTD